MAKYNLELKLAVVKHAETHRAGHKSTAKHFGIGKTSVYKWMQLYEKHGSQGLTAKYSHYSGEFKMKVIQHKLRHNLTAQKTAAFFNIPSFSSVHTWLNIYTKYGEKALYLDHRRHPKKLLTKIPKKSNNFQKNFTEPTPNKPFSEMTQEEMVNELEELRLENAYLKKLEALIQQEQELVQKKKY